MSNAANKLLLAAAGNTGGGSVYVDDVFSTYLYDGNGSTQNIVNGLDLSGEGGLVWIKARNQSYNHFLFDTARGASSTITADGTGAAFTTSRISSFNNNGFSLGTDDFGNGSGNEYVAWSFRKTEKFFDVVTYTGNGTSGRTVNHNLGSVPGMMLVKRTSSAEKWAVYHRSADASAPEDKYLVLNTDGILADNDNIWNDTAPTSTQFTVGSDAMVNGNGDSYVAYLFAHDEQDFGTDSDEAIIKCGSYSGNSGSQTIDVGFEAQWVLIKNITSGSTDWFMVDVMRGIPDTASYDASLIRANENDQEQTSGAGGARIAARSTGFGFLTESNLSCNRSGETYVYVAIRRPHKPVSEFAATDVFNVDAGANTTPGFDTGFPVDMGIFRAYSYSGDFDIMSRLTGLRRLDFPSAGAEANKGTGAQMDHMDGWSTNAGALIGWAWRRAPGYFDVVAYTGTGGSTNTINHNLGVVPEMMWVKRRDASDSWWIYHKDMTGTPHNAYMILDTQAAVVTGNDAGFGNTAPTATQFTVGGFPAASGQDWMAYLFASVDGISKISKYTGTGSNIDVDCGFSAGARFVLIKRSDSTGDWYLYDSVQGIVAGNDPYLLTNSTAAQVTNTDYIDPLNAGFTVTSSAPAALNASGGTYIFYAIA